MAAPAQAPADFCRSIDIKFQADQTRSTSKALEEKALTLGLELLFFNDRTADGIHKAFERFHKAFDRFCA
jgi:hypothetical protein